MIKGILYSDDIEKEYTANPLYFSINKAAAEKDYDRAQKYIEEFAKIPKFEVRSLRSLAALKLRQGKNEEAESLALESYKKGQKMAASIYIKALLEQGKLEEAGDALNLMNEVVLFDPNILENIFLYLHEIGLYGHDEDQYMRIVFSFIRNIGIEILQDSPNAISFLAANAKKPADIILKNYLVENLSERFRDSLAENKIVLKKGKLPPVPDSQALELFWKNSLAVQYNAKYQKKEWQQAIDILDNIMDKHPEHGLICLQYMAQNYVQSGDYTRAEQLAELAFKIGFKPAIAQLYFALIMDKKYEKIKLYENELIRMAFTSSTCDDPIANAFGRLCLVTGQKTLFLDWVRKYPWDSYLATEEVRQMTLILLKQWGSPLDSLLIDFLERNPSRHLGISFDWGASLIQKENSTYAAMPKPVLAKPHKSKKQTEG